MSNVEGAILRIERSSIHDGQGLRTVLFFKGCPLSCQWCSTPESQRSGPELGYVVDRCAGCGTCVSHCPAGAISLAGKYAETDTDRCRDCLICVTVCPKGARKVYGRLLTVAEAVAEISKDEIFFFHSGGGVTLSGGECLLQPDFAAGVLQGCRQRGIDTAVETSLYAPWPHVEKILPFVNTFYVDLKHPDSATHKILVGVENGLILDNLRRLDKSEVPVSLHLRIPLIPGINDSDATLAAMAVISAGFAKLQGIEFLPYHRLGVATYSQLDRQYLLEDVATPSRDYIIERTTFIKKLGFPVPVKVGGCSI